MTKTLLNTLALTALLGFSAPLAAQAADTYKMDPAHTTVIWKATHFEFSAPEGLFPMVDGTITLDDADLAKSKVEATIDTSKITTGNPKFDEHLKGKDFFNTAANKPAKFVSTKVEPTGKDTAKVTGDLTLNGVTKPVVLDVKFNKKGEHPFTKKETVGFSATGTVKRSEFGLSYALPNVSDDVSLQIETEASIDGAPNS